MTHDELSEFATQEVVSIRSFAGYLSETAFKAAKDRQRYALESENSRAAFTIKGVYKHRAMIEEAEIVNIALKLENLLIRLDRYVRKCNKN